MTKAKTLTTIKRGRPRKGRTPSAPSLPTRVFKTGYGRCIAVSTNPHRPSLHTTNDVAHLFIRTATNISKYNPGYKFYDHQSVVLEDPREHDKPANVMWTMPAATERQRDMFKRAKRASDLAFKEMVECIFTKLNRCREATTPHKTKYNGVTLVHWAEARPIYDNVPGSRQGYGLDLRFYTEGRGKEGIDYEEMEYHMSSSINWERRAPRRNATIPKNSRGYFSVCVSGSDQVQSKLRWWTPPRDENVLMYIKAGNDRAARREHDRMTSFTEHLERGLEHVARKFGKRLCALLE